MNYYIKKLASGEYMDTVETWEAFDEIAQAIGGNELLNAMTKALGTDELKDIMKGIVRDYDLNTEEED